MRLALHCVRELTLERATHGQRHVSAASGLVCAFGRAREPAPRRMHEHRLPRIEGVPLAFTDGVALADGRWLFTAVAEATDDSIADGACVGGVVGLMNAQGQLRRLWRLPNRDKVEGIAVRERDGGIDLALVTDADDPKLPSRLLVARVNAP
jgi:hypothetical protein